MGERRGGVGMDIAGAIIVPAIGRGSGMIIAEAICVPTGGIQR